MTRNATKTRAVLVACGALFSLTPLTASALGLTIVNVSSSGASTSLLLDGDVLTIDLHLENVSRAAVAGLGIGVTGYDVGNDGVLTNNHLRYAGGSVASSALNTSFVDPDYIGGIDNIRNAPTELGAGSPINSPRRIQLFDGVAITTSNGNGTFDPGVDGLPTGPNGAQFRIQFRAVALASALGVPQVVNLNFGVGQFGNTAIDGVGNEIPFSNTSYTVSVVPEPGTALLMGLGLAGLAARRRR